MTPKTKSLIEFNSRLDAILFATEATESPNKPKWDGAAVRSAIADLRASHESFAKNAYENAKTNPSAPHPIGSITDHFLKTQKQIRAVMNSYDSSGPRKNAQSDVA
jgi:hypothetical protein